MVMVVALVVGLVQLLRLGREQIVVLHWYQICLIQCYWSGFNIYIVIVIVMGVVWLVM